MPLRCSRVALCSSLFLLVVAGNPAFAAFDFVDRANLSSDEVQVTGFDTPVNWATISRDGRFIAFDSFGPSLVPNDTNGIADVFVRDLALGTTVRVSVHADGTQALGVEPSISATGRFVAFSSFSQKLIGTDTDMNGSCDVGCDTNGIADIFVRDRDTDGDGIFDEAGAVSTERVSLTSAGAQIESMTPCSRPAISGDGRWIVFTTQAILVPEDTNGLADVYAADRVTHAIARISVATNGAQSNTASGTFLDIRPVTNGDGRFVVFGSAANTLVANDTNGVSDIFLRDRDTDENGVFDEPGAVATTRISVDAAGAELANPDLIGGASISSDGRYVGWSSSADVVVNDGNPDGSDVFVLDRDTGTVDAFGIDPSGPGCCGNVIHEHGISDDGTRIVFDVNHNVTITNGMQITVRSVSDVVVATRGGAVAQITDSPEPAMQSDPNIYSFTYGVSGDGRVVLGGSTDPSIVPGDSNGRVDVVYAAEGPLVFPTATPGGGGPTPTPTPAAPRLDDAAAAKAAVKCQKQADAGGAKLLGAVLKGLDKCGQSLLACAQSVDAAKRDACKTKARAACAKAFAKIAAAQGTLIAAVPAKCDALTFADATSEAGLGYGGAFTAAACEGPPANYAELGTCLALQDSCGATRLVGRVLPRVRALLLDAGLTTGDLDALPCLPGPVGDGSGVADAATAKLVLGCAKAAGKAAAKLVGLTVKSLTKCHEAVLACVQQKPGDAKCLPKTGKTCTGLVAKITDGIAGLEEAVTAKCEAAGFPTLAAADGIAWGVLGTECNGVGITPTSVPTYATCLARSAVCAGGNAVFLGAPRLGETLALAGVDSATSFCTGP